MANLPSVIQLAENVIAPAIAPQLAVDQAKKIVLCISRDISDEDRAIFSGYGRLLDYEHDIHNNISPDTFLWDYLTIDLRESGDRYFLMKQILPFKEKYSIVVYSYAFERDEIVPNADNHISSFPKKQARKEDFELILLQQRIKKVRWYTALFSCILATYHQVKN